MLPMLGRSDMPPDRLDVTSGPAPKRQPAPRPWISVWFACCGCYQRVYRTPDATAYRGRCPRCGGAVSFRVGEGGTAQRQFVAR